MTGIRAKQTLGRPFGRHHGWRLQVGYSLTRLLQGPRFPADARSRAASASPAIDFNRHPALSPDAQVALTLREV